MSGTIRCPGCLGCGAVTNAVVCLECGGKGRIPRKRAQFGVQADACREAPCVACGDGPAEPHHVVSRGAGGLDSDCVPLCRTCHDEIHRHGRAGFEATWGIDLKAKAAELCAHVRGTG